MVHCQLKAATTSTLSHRAAAASPGALSGAPPRWPRRAAGCRARSRRAGRRRSRGRGPRRLPLELADSDEILELSRGTRRSDHPTRSRPGRPSPGPSSCPATPGAAPPTGTRSASGGRCGPGRAGGALDRRAGAVSTAPRMERFPSREVAHGLVVSVQLRPSGRPRPQPLRHDQRAG